MENRYDLFIPEKNSAKILLEFYGCPGYSVNDAVRADFVFFFLKQFQIFKHQQIFGAPYLLKQEFFSL